MATVAKAIAAFCTTAAGVATSIYLDGNVEAVEVIVGACTVIGATAAVWAIPNAEEHA